MDASSNRVYVNPNFNRVPNRTVFTSMPTYSNKYMHVNPKFARNVQNVQQNSNLNRKIYVNPNFIKSSNISDIKNDSKSKMLNYNNRELDHLNDVNNKCYNTTSCITGNSKPLQSNSAHPLSNSKYRLVRNNDVRVLDKDYQMKETGTIKISKYKSIPINNYKSNLQFVKDDVTIKQKQSKSNIIIPQPKYVKKSCFKIVKQSLTSTNSPLKGAMRVNCLRFKKSVDSSLQLKLKISVATRKINNIPCRLFTKYGTCIRNLSGICEYLHDRKHVSLCRKFLKGICHDKRCLLSHELSSKKMPTCFFYLKGMCTKTDCAYLHVKLSEKSKICHEFLKGYCDKGDVCPYRHIRPHENKKSSDNILTKYKFNRTVKLALSKIHKTNLSRRLYSQILKKRAETIHSIPICKNEQDNTNDSCRYFKEELQSQDVMCEVLKPTRCKLGTLPSFIQL